MTFSYTPSDVNDITRVRFHTGQTVEAESFLTDEDITMMLAEAGSVGGAVVACLKFIIARLSQPNFRADWLQVDNASARKGFETLLAEKRREFGIPAVSGRGLPVYRGDSCRTPDDCRRVGYDLDRCD